MNARWLAVLVSFLAIGACGPGRTTYARYPGAPAAFDRAHSDPKAVELADKVVEATGGHANWDKAKQVRWGITIKDGDKTVFDGEEAWDRWNGRHWGRIHTGDVDLIVIREIYSESPGTFMIDKGASGMVKQPDEDANTRKNLSVAAERWKFDTAALCVAFLLEEPGTKLSYVGEAKDEDGKPLEAIKIEFDPKDATRQGAAYQIEVNPQTHMIERFELVKPDGNVGYKVSGWVDVGGLKFPTLHSNIGYAAETIAFKDIKVGEPQDELYSRIH